MTLPRKTVERLSQYRRVLQRYTIIEESYIFSHDLARLLKLTAVQVRRDLMLLGISGNYRSGYNVREVLSKIDGTLSVPKTQKATIIGMGSLGKSLLKHIHSNPVCPAIIPATFDVKPKNTNQDHHGVPCLDFYKFPEIAQKEDIKIVILALVTPDIQEIIDSLMASNIKAIVNFTGGPFRVPDDVYVKDYDIRTTMDELSYFISQENEIM